MVGPADAATVAALAASPHRAAIAAVVEATFEDLVTQWAPQRFGRTWFRTILPAGSN